MRAFDHWAPPPRSQSAGHVRYVKPGFDSISQNAVPNLDAKQDGGYSGLLELNTGDQVHFVCDITNRHDTTLRYANELLTGEMCMVAGTSVGDGTFTL